MESVRWRERLAALTCVAVVLTGGCPGERTGPSIAPPRPGEQGELMPGPDPDLVRRPLYTFDEDELDRYLRALHQAEPDLVRRILTLGRKNLGQPYEIFLLGEFPFEEYDPDPIYCLARGDCLTFCEHTYAMALASNWWDFLRTLQRLRYRDGVIGMLTRNHYTEADWNRHNAFLFEDCTARLGGGRWTVPLRHTVRRAAFFARYGIGQDLPDEPFSDVYLPKDHVPAILAELRDADFVNIIRGDDQSQWAGHTGIIARAVDGTVNLLHSARPTVREEPLLDYLAGDERCIGIKILRLRPDAQAIMREALASSPQATEVSEASLAAALGTRRQAAPSTAPPPAWDWRRAMRLQAYRLDEATPLAPDLQVALEAIDRRLGELYDIPQTDRAVGVLDLNDLRLAMVNPDRMFCGAGVAELGILLAYFQTYPQGVADLPAEVQRGLGRMIKVGDPHVAAEYSQLLGPERIQEVLRADRYRFYDPTRGRGLWYGQHPGQVQSGMSDSLHDPSCGATVRQCLRFYLMLEQGRLVSGPASAKIREVFAAPELEHVESGFVRGLQGRDLTLIRKSSTWQDWQLDTARIEHRQQIYLLVGMVRHPAGDDYLARMAAAVDEHLCGPPMAKPFANQLVLHDTAEEFATGTVRGGVVRDNPPGVLLTCPTVTDDAGHAQATVYESAVVESNLGFNEALISWNVEAPPHASFCVEARVGRRRDDSWSPYLYFGDWGDYPSATRRTVRWAHGRVDVDYFRSEERFDRLQYRIQALCRPLPWAPAAAPAKLRITCVAACLSDTTRRISAVPVPPQPAAPPVSGWRRRLAVPFRSQKSAPPELTGRICSPTSVAMMLEYRGVTRPTDEIARRAFDAVHDLYGNWPRAVQTAYTYGVPGYLTRFSDWAEVQRMIADDQPLIISITAEAGELTGAPFSASEGHLLLLTGFDSAGDLYVNDPAFTDADRGQTVYRRSDLDKVWLTAKAGTAFVLLAAPEPQPLPPPVDPAAEPLVDLADVAPRIVIDLRYATPASACAHREILTEAMEAEGFAGLDSEWWHFDAPGWEQYPVPDVPLTEVGPPVVGSSPGGTVPAE
ncbi:MAG: N-acetylmuramoyl-L-alanine amidase-like domain-containing protein [Planctomycetota bacterium]